MMDKKALNIIKGTEHPEEFNPEYKKTIEKIIQEIKRLTEHPTWEDLVPLRKMFRDMELGYLEPLKDEEEVQEEIAKALFNPKLIELYPSMRWENLPGDIRKAYLDRASDIIAKMEELGYHKPPKGANWNKVEEELTGGLSEFVGWDTRLIVRSNLMPVIKKLCTLRADK